MKNKNFSTVFGILFDTTKNFQKTFYRLLSQSVYRLANYGMYSDDTLCKITSGTQPIFGKVLKIIAK